MASKQKKRSVNNTSESEDDVEHHIENEIQADFEGRNPEAEDFHGIKQLLKQLFLKAHLDTSQLSDMLISQPGIGSVLKQCLNDDEEDEDMENTSDVFGITSVINLSSHSETPVVQQLLNLLKEFAQQHTDKAIQAQVNSILTESKRIGLLINERFVNIPPKVADPLFTSLEAEINRMTKKDPSYAFQYFIMICKMYKPKGNARIDSFFSNAEEEVFSKEAEVGFEFSVATQSDTGLSGSWSEDDAEMIPYRKVLLIKGNKLPTIIQNVKELVA